MASRSRERIDSQMGEVVIHHRMETLFASAFKKKESNPGLSNGRSKPTSSLEEASASGKPKLDQNQKEKSGSKKKRFRRRGSISETST